MREIAQNTNCQHQLCQFGPLQHWVWNLFKLKNSGCVENFRNLVKSSRGNAMSNSSVVVQVRTVNSCVRYGKVPVRVTCVLVPVVLQ